MLHQSLRGTELNSTYCEICLFLHHIIIINYSTSDLQPSTAILNQPPSQLVSTQITTKGYKFIMALTILNVLIIYKLVLLYILHYNGFHYWSRAYTEIPTTPDHECIHIATYIHVHFSLHVTSQLTTPCAIMNWKPYALIERVHDF